MNPTTLNIMGGTWPLIWLCLTLAGILYQRHHNRDIWRDEYKKRQKETKRAEGKYALCCAVICLAIYFIEKNIHLPEDPKAKKLIVRTLVMLYMICWGFLLNKFKHSANYLVRCNRLEPKPGVTSTEFTLLNLKGWNIPAIKYEQPKHKSAYHQPKKPKIVNLSEVQQATSDAIRTIDCIWLIMFSIVVPTVEFWITHKSFGFVFGPLRIL